MKKRNGVTQIGFLSFPGLFFCVYVCVVFVFLFNLVCMFVLVFVFSLVCVFIFVFVLVFVFVFIAKSRIAMASMAAMAAM